MTNLLTASQVSEILSIGRSTVFRLAANGTLPSVRLADRVLRFDPADVEAYVQRSKVVSA